MSSNFTQTQRDLLNNVKQAVALVDKELQRIRPNFEGFENNIPIYQWLVSHFEF
jgi:hypothetical protein